MAPCEVTECQPPWWDAEPLASKSSNQIGKGHDELQGLLPHFLLINLRFLSGAQPSLFLLWEIHQHDYNSIPSWKPWYKGTDFIFKRGWSKSLLNCGLDDLLNSWFSVLIWSALQIMRKLACWARSTPQPKVLGQQPSLQSIASSSNLAQ